PWPSPARSRAGEGWRAIRPHTRTRRPRRWRASWRRTPRRPPGRPARRGCASRRSAPRRARTESRSVQRLMGWWSRGTTGEARGWRGLAEERFWARERSWSWNGTQHSVGWDPSNMRGPASRAPSPAGKRQRASRWLARCNFCHSMSLHLAAGQLREADLRLREDVGLGVLLDHLAVRGDGLLRPRAFMVRSPRVDEVPRLEVLEIGGLGSVG